MWCCAQHTNCGIIPLHFSLLCTTHWTVVLSPYTSLSVVWCCVQHTNCGIITLHFSLLCDVVYNTLTVVLSPYTFLSVVWCCVQHTNCGIITLHFSLLCDVVYNPLNCGIITLHLSLLCDVVYNTLTVVLSPYTSLSVVWCCYTAVYVHSRFKSSLGLMLCVIDISTLNKTYLIYLICILFLFMCWFVFFDHDVDYCSL